MSRSLILTVTVAASVIAATLLAVLVTRTDQPPAAAPPSTPPGVPMDGLEASTFLDTYVENGRVVRHDQGGDTVSEGQAYGLLISLAVDDRETFERVWTWTRQELGRPDGLLSWRWHNGSVTDPSSAADADLDAARALVLAGDRWDEPRYTEDGLRLGDALLDHETVRTQAGLVLTAGSWVSNAPYAFNPSYVSPVATQVLAEASADPRWERLEAGSRAAVEAATGFGGLPPDWATVGEDGVVTPAPGPAGEPVRYGYDAARTLLRHAESCEPEDRRIAAEAAAVVDGDAVAVHDLAGSPQTDVQSPLTLVAQAAGYAAAGDRSAALAELRAAREAQRNNPTYYGDAWTVLGRELLTDPSLGGCAALVAS